MALKLDHVAWGVSDAAPVLKRLSAELGGTVIGGGTPPGKGFRVVHVHLGEPDDVGMTVELLEPWEPENDDFLDRFVRTRGDGPHHITFKTDDIVAEQKRLMALGLTPIGVSIDNPPWREMFLHPRDAHGIVVQIAQSDSVHPPMAQRLRMARDKDETFEGKQRWWNEAATGRAPSSVLLRSVIMQARDQTATTAFWVDVMQADHDRSELVWDGGRIRVVPGDRDGVEGFEVAGLIAPVTVGGALLVPV